MTNIYTPHVYIYIYIYIGKGAEAGLIAVDIHGNVGISLNSLGMYRGIVNEDNVKKTAVWHEEWQISS